MLSDLSATTCPHCNAPIEIVYVPADGDQEYIEDCEVCCKPMLVQVIGNEVIVERET
ncbi:CPXCG motif-containing cysteine-rich protein [Salinibius halmophilus]|uniref:CPXCG motif-containing cysteine-rich protein n=1 Tax=Salinibius halmophilus TaxID=1853216 RepID=UPI000E670320|nr:CPXCG motif-containing cysteine-rich protein [Salinibius halmophilus]